MRHIECVRWLNEESASAQHHSVTGQTSVCFKRDGRTDIRADGQIRVKQAGALDECNIRRVFASFGFIDDFDEAPVTPACTANSHGDADGGTIRRIDPRMIGNREKRG